MSWVERLFPCCMTSSILHSNNLLFISFTFILYKCLTNYVKISLTGWIVSSVRQIYSLVPVGVLCHITKVPCVKNKMNLLFYNNQPVLISICDNKFSPHSHSNSPIRFASLSNSTYNFARLMKKMQVFGTISVIYCKYWVYYLTRRKSRKDFNDEFQ